MAYTIEWKCEGAILRFENDVSLNDISEAHAEFFNDHRFHKCSFFIWDGQEIENLKVSEFQIDIPATLSQFASQKNPDLFGAYITPRGEVTHIIHHYIRTTARQGVAWVQRHFNTFSKAESWLAVRHNFRDLKCAV